MDKRESEAREVLRRIAGWNVITDQDREDINIPVWAALDAMLEFANRPAADLEAALSDPAAVHLNMLRGNIAKPTPANIWHLYGDDALIGAMPVAAREKVGNPNHSAADLEAVKEACAEVAESDIGILPPYRPGGSFGAARSDQGRVIASAIRSLDLSAITGAGDG